MWTSGLFSTNKNANKDFQLIQEADSSLLDKVLKGACEELEAYNVGLSLYLCLTYSRIFCAKDTNGETFYVIDMEVFAEYIKIVDSLGEASAKINDNNKRILKDLRKLHKSLNSIEAVEVRFIHFNERKRAVGFYN